MSGIAGIIRFDGGPVERDLITSMTGALAHRGPDDTRQWVAGPVALGHVMLRTTPESLEETQPAANEDESVVLTMDGRIDNWEDLRASLVTAGARLRNRSDAELVLRAYECWGDDLLDRLEGDFAFVLWDARRHRALCARDQVGARPFYYHWNGSSLVFASELHAVLNVPWVPETFNDGLATEFLGNDLISRDETLWCGVHRLVAAHRLIVDGRGIKVEEYWKPDLEKEIRYRRPEEYADHYRSLLENIIHRQSRSHLPIACEVSGGIDSSAVFAVAERLRLSGRLLAPAVEASTIRFKSGSEADEITYARAVGAHLNRPIREIEPCLAPLEWFEDWAMRYRDFPHYANTVLPLNLLNDAAGRGIRTVLTGYGGDEWQMGTRYYYADCLGEFDLRGLARNFTLDVRSYGLSRALYWFVRCGLFPYLPRRAQGRLKQISARLRSHEPDCAEWLTPEMQAMLEERRRHRSDRTFRVKRKQHETAFATLVSAMRAHTRESFNALASSVGVERRDPLASISIVRFHFATPENTRLRGNQYRLTHRTAMRGLVPDMVLDRITKAHFSHAIRWHLPHFQFGGSIALRNAAPNWVNPKAVSERLASAEGGQSDNIPLWSIWALAGCHLVRRSPKR